MEVTSVVHILQYYSVTKENEIMPSATACVDLEIIY